MIDGIPVLLLVWCLVAGALVSAFGVLGGIVWVVVKLFGRAGQSLDDGETSWICNGDCPICRAARKWPAIR